MKVRGTIPRTFPFWVCWCLRRLFFLNKQWASKDQPQLFVVAVTLAVSTVSNQKVAPANVRLPSHCRLLRADVAPSASAGVRHVVFRVAILSKGKPLSRRHSSESCSCLQTAKKETDSTLMLLCFHRGSYMIAVWDQKRSQIAVQMKELIVMVALCVALALAQ